ncbi:cysteine proteinase superfamily protein, partial [Tanacetum coccineum]
MRRNAMRRVARVPVSLNELEINGNERAYDTGRFIWYPSVSDGNCFFRSCSQGIAGHHRLHVIFRKGTEAWMRAHLHRYKHPNMSLDAFREYLTKKVGVMGSDVGMDVVQGVADLLRTRMVRTYARGSKVIDEVTPFD